MKKIITILILLVFVTVSQGQMVEVMRDTSLGITNSSLNGDTTINAAFYRSHTINAENKTISVENYIMQWKYRFLEQDTIEEQEPFHIIIGLSDTLITGSTKLGFYEIIDTIHAGGFDVVLFIDKLMINRNGKF
jgi:hypothetical protein